MPSILNIESEVTAVLILASIFRNSTLYLDRYFKQVADLRNHYNGPVHVIAIEGDSHDLTYSTLKLNPDIDTLLTCEHGGDRYGSVDHPQRWRQIACPANVALCAANRLIQPGDAFVYVESDLHWAPETIITLARHVDHYPAVAPMSFHDGSREPPRFYDIWGYRRNSIRFSPQFPYHPDLGQDMIQVDSSGSCFALNSDALQIVEFSAVDCILGVGRSLYAHGMDLHLDPTLAVWHP